MPYFRSHPNGHESYNDEEDNAAAAITMSVEESDDCFVAGFLRPLYRPDSETDRNRSSNPAPESSNPSGATIVEGPNGYRQIYNTESIKDFLKPTGS